MTESVILLHGLARTHHSMAKLEKALSDKAYHVVNANYPSRRYDIETLAELTISKALEACVTSERISFVTHSMGGILVRQYCQSHSIPALHRVVMLGPPNQGSEIVDHLASVPGFKWINGEAGTQLGTQASSLPSQLDTVTFDLGVIAGNRSLNVLLSQLIHGPNDGKVSVERTKAPGMKAHLVMPVTHTFMMRNTNVIKQVIHYLENGCFDLSDHTVLQ